MKTGRSTRKMGMFILASLLLLFALTACGGNGGGNDAAESEAVSSDTLDSIISSGKIKVAIPQDTPLFGTQGSDGSYEGYDIDMANLIAADLGVEVELVPVTSKNRIPFLTANKADLVISSMGVKPDRALVINFSTPYAPFFWAAYGPADLDVNSVEDAADIKVGATLGTLEEIAFTDAAVEGTDIQRFDDQATTVQAFLSGQVDLIVTGNAIAANMIKNNPDMNIESKFVLQQSPCHIGVRKADRDLLNYVNSSIYVHKLNGDLDALSMEWFGEPLPDFPQY